MSLPNNITQQSKLTTVIWAFCHRPYYCWIYTIFIRKGKTIIKTNKKKYVKLLKMEKRIQEYTTAAVNINMQKISK